MASSGMWTASSSAGNSTCSWPPEALNSSTKCFNPVSKWRILRIFFNCTRIWRDVGRQAEHLRVRYTLDLQFRSIEVNQDLAISDSSAIDTTLPMKVSSAIAGEDTPQCDRPHHGCQTTCISQSFRQVPKPCLFPLIHFPHQNSTQQPILAVVAFSVVCLSLECDQYPTDHVDWGGWGTSYLSGTPLEPKNTCVSMVTLFQAASILLFQAAYFWLKFREALSAAAKRKLSDLQGVGLIDKDVHQVLKGVYTRAIKDKSSGKVVRYKYEPRFKPAREKNGRTVISFPNLSLGSYDNRRDAEIVRQIAAFYYGEGSEFVSLGEGRSFRIPAISHGLSGHDKASRVSMKTKEVFESYCKPNKTATAESLQSDGLPDPSLQEIRSVVNALPCDTMSHSRDGTSNIVESLSENSPVELTRLSFEENLGCVSHPRIDPVQHDTVVDLRAAGEKLNIAELVVQHTGVDNMVVDKEGETLQVFDPSTRSLNFHQQPTGWNDDAERLNSKGKLESIRKFLLDDPEVAGPGNRVQLHQSEGLMDSAYDQLPTLIFFPSQVPHCSTPCDTTIRSQSLSQSEQEMPPKCLPNGIHLESLKHGAAISCKWSLDALTSEGALVHNSCSCEVPRSSPMFDPQQVSNAMATALTKEVTPSLLANLCSENCIAELLVKVVSLQQQQITELKRENECLKGLKCSLCYSHRSGDQPA
ncbi:hypothetical protein M758_9G177400 [Ceratodon purpureus]|nr:hypothetical protein M758_9G177400 [Ceratodon purpureus]